MNINQRNNFKSLRNIDIILNNKHFFLYTELILLSLFTFSALHYSIKTTYLSNSIYFIFIAPISLLALGIFVKMQDSTIGLLHYLRSISLLILAFTLIKYFKYRLSKDVVYNILTPIGCENMQNLGPMLLFGLLISSIIIILLSIISIDILTYIKNLFCHYQKRFNKPYPLNENQLFKYLNAPHNNYKQSETPSIQIAITLSEVLTLLLAFTQIATTPEIETIRYLASQLPSSNCHQIFNQINEAQRTYFSLLNSPAIIAVEIYASLQLSTISSKARAETIRRDNRLSVRTYNRITDYFRSILTNQPIPRRSHPIFPLLTFVSTLTISSKILQIHSPFIFSSPYISIILAIFSTAAYTSNIYPNKVKKKDTQKIIYALFILISAPISILSTIFIMAICTRNTHRNKIKERDTQKVKEQHNEQ